MKVSLRTPLDEPAKFRITYNGEELFVKEFAAGETPSLAFDTPAGKSGRARVFLIKGDKEIPFGTASYYFDDVMGAKMLIEDAAELTKDEKKTRAWRARTKLLKAVKLLEKLAPDSEDLASAYLQLCYVHCFYCKPRKHMKAKRQQQAIAWYEKVIAVHERNGNVEHLKGDLINISVLYQRAGELDTALARSLRALAIEKKQPTPADDPGYDERVAAWSHAASCHLRLGQLDEAEAVIKDGLDTCGADTPNCGYLWGLQAQVYDERAKRCRQKAEEILPPVHCSID